MITGVAGFIGRYVCDTFVAHGWHVIGVGSRPSGLPATHPNINYEAVKLPSSQIDSLLNQYQPDLCIHCAGSASVGNSVEAPDHDFHNNVVVTFELLNALRQHVPDCRFIFLSSAAVYGNPYTLPVKESFPIRPISPYGYHKYLSELQCQQFHQIYNLPTASVRIFSAYGTGLQRQVVYDLCRRAMSNSTLELYGTGEESRDFIHAKDIASGLLTIAENAQFIGEVYNLSSGVETTIRRLAEGILETIGEDKLIQCNGILSEGVPRNWQADISLVTSLGFEPTMSLENGLTDVVRWIQEQESV